MMKGERIAQLELLLRSHPEGLRRAEIARRMGVHRSTISRYVDDLAQHIGIYEENNLIKLKENDEDSSPMELSVYESLAFNMGAEVLASTAEFANPHLASGLRKLAMNMRSYAPKISENALFVVDEGQLRCSSCRSSRFELERYGVEIPAQGLDLLRHVQQSFPSGWPDGELSPPVRRACARAIDGFVQYHLGLAWEGNYFRRV